MSKLYIANIPFGSTEDELKSVFEVVGTVKSCRIIMDKEKGRSRGFGFVEMGNDQEAQTAIDNINGQEVDGRALVVRLANNT